MTSAIVRIAQQVGREKNHVECQPLVLQKAEETWVGAIGLGVDTHVTSMVEQQPLIPHLP